MKKFSVIIPCRNEEKHIKLCIDAILANDYGPENIEILVVDGMSDDSSRNIIRELSLKNSNVKLIDNVGQITPLAFNLGIKNSIGEYIAIVGARHLIEKNYISQCVSILNSDEKIGCVGGKVTNVYENPTSKIIASAMASSFGVGIGNFRNKEKDGYTDTVGTPVFRKSVFDEIGFFDEELVRNQDDELSFRLIKKGYKIYFTVKTGIKYFVRANYKNLYRQYFQYGYWKVYVNRKHKTITTFRQTIPALFVLFVIAGFILSLFSKYIVIAYLSVLALYFLLAVISAFAAIDEKKNIVKMVYSYLILHWAYGTGYLKGMLHFVVFKRKLASGQSKSLSR